MATDIRFTLNGRATSVRVDPGQTLLDVLRGALGLKSTRFGCGPGGIRSDDWESYPIFGFAADALMAAAQSATQD